MLGSAARVRQQLRAATERVQAQDHERGPTPAMPQAAKQARKARREAQAQSSFAHLVGGCVQRPDALVACDRRVLHVVQGRPEPGVCLLPRYRHRIVDVSRHDLHGIAAITRNAAGRDAGSTPSCNAHSDACLSPASLSGPADRGPQALSLYHAFGDRAYVSWSCSHTKSSTTITMPHEQSRCELAHVQYIRPA